MWDYQVLGVGVVGVHNGSGFGQGSEVLLGGGSVVWIKRSHGAVGIEDKLGLGGGQNSGQYLGRRRVLVLWALLFLLTRNCMAETVRQRDTPHQLKRTRGSWAVFISTNRFSPSQLVSLSSGQTRILAHRQPARPVCGHQWIIYLN